MYRYIYIYIKSRIYIYIVTYIVLYIYNMFLTLMSCCMSHINMGGHGRNVLKENILPYK